jgi:hypothetical protein
MGKTPSGIR